jgi:hypothetical protein
MRFLLALVLGSCLFPTVKVLAQQLKDDDSIPIVFHVTSVKQGYPPECAMAACRPILTVEGYARVEHDAHPTQFVLTCVEFTVSKPTPQKMSCAHLRASADYDANLFGNVIDFPTQHSPRVLFNIVSQKENE